MKRRRYPYWLNLAIAIDQLGAAIIGWDCDVTISTQIGRTIERYGAKNETMPRKYWFLRTIAWCLDKIDPNHCEDAKE